MTTAHNIEMDNLDEFQGLTNYIEVLMSTFPKPITRKELAKKTGVSQPAITKVKDRLLRLCERNTLIFSRKLILRTDETFWKLLVFYFLQMKPTRMLLSRYGLEMIQKMNIHSKISERFKEYASHFNEKDTETMIGIILHNLGNFQITNQIKTKIGDPQQRVMLLSTQYITAIEGIFQKLDLPMENDKDLLSILTIRDKLFCLTKRLLWQQVQKASVLQELSKTEKRTYLKVYSRTMDFYLRKLFKTGSDFIEQIAQRKKLDFREDYKKIGYFHAYPTIETEM